jgi:hypothetical protein
MIENPLFSNGPVSSLSGPLFGGQRRGRSYVPVAPDLTEEDERSLLRELASKTGQAIESLGLVLDFPGAVARGVLAGEPLSGFNFNFDDRVSGVELLEKFGLQPQNPYVKAAAGFGAEIVTDPMFWLSGGLSSVTRAGDAAKAAGLLKTAPLAYMQKFGTDAAEQTLRGKYVTKLFDDSFIPRTAGNYKAVAPVGQRVAQANVTLDDVIRASANPTKATEDVINRLGSREAYDSVKDDVLGGLFGVNALGINEAFSPPGTNQILDALDYLGARTRFSYAGRLGAAAFSKATGGAVGAGEQIASLRASVLEDAARADAREAATKHGLLLSKIALSDNSKSLLGADSLFSQAGNDLLKRLEEGKANSTDLQIIAATPGLTEWKNSWSTIRNQIFSEREAIGLKSPSKYRDKYKTEYGPRFGDEFDFADQARGTGKLRFTAAEPETYGRRKHLQTPGGTDDLRQISLLPDVIAHSSPTATTTDEEVGEKIIEWFKLNHPAEPIGLPQAALIARTMSRRKQDLPANVPVFAAHPANTQSRRIISHAVAQSRANFILESLAEAAIQGGRTQQVGRYRKLSDSWDEIAKKTGFAASGKNAAKSAVDSLRAKISLTSGVPIDQIDLSAMAVPEQVVRRLERIGDFYSVPQAQGEVVKFLDGWTQLFKAFVLATPRRFVRDAYSNAISGFLETGNAPLQLASMNAASKVVAGKYDEALPALKQIPKYAGMTDEQALNQFLIDSGRTGVLEGLQSSELLSSVRAGSMSQLIPGSTPLTISKGIGQLIPDGSRNPAQMASDFFSPFQDFLTNRVGQQYEQRNPMLMASNTINDTVDSIGRLGTFIALLRQGVNEQEAADRVRRALVDYQSLTLTERKWLRSMFPWYAYNSRIGKYVAESLYMRPGGPVSQMIRGSIDAQRGDEDQDYIPSNLRKAFAIRIPDSVTKYMGMYQPDLTWYAKDFDLPGVDTINLIDPNSFQGTLKNLFSQSSPPLQSIVSLATGRDLFTDRPLAETVTPQDRIYKALTGDPGGLSPTTKVLTGLIPGLQVPIQLGGKMLDERIENPSMRALTGAINYLSGIKVQPIDERYLRQDLEQKIGEELDGKQRGITIRSIPAELEPTLTPKQYKLNQLSKKNQKEARKLREEARAKKAAKEKKKTGQP